ncbi:hypothetical protein [Streptomyces sp. RTd22]|uniref:hypothetical protein n=1 Tax=Streptomyces sp. RTd22 TaxID=1841249 RepID=UPI0007C4BEB8|nr:hypothetical protein [Streptomyces sp. RTd22]
MGLSFAAGLTALALAEMAGSLAWAVRVAAVLVIMAALLADAAYGQRWFFLVLGVGLGGTAWIQLARARRA